MGGNEICVRRATAGFTLLEVICAVAIMAVLTAMSARVGIRYVEKAREAKYSAEAYEVWSAVQMYMIEYDGEEPLDMMELMDQLMVEPLSSEDHLLSEYLYGICSEGAEIENVTIQGMSVEELIYRVNGLRLIVRRGGVTVDRTDEAP